MSDVPESSARLFPLLVVEENPPKKRRLSVRGAYQASSPFFTKPVDTDNHLSKKLSGDDLEVLALASLTLASLQSEKQVFEDIVLPTFLASVFHFMSDKPLDKESMEATAKAVQALLKDSKFVAIKVPTFPSTGSCFSVPFSELSDKCGIVDRPPDSERCDGHVKCGDKKVLHLECKNLMGGLTTEVFKKVIECMRLNCDVSLLFTSDLNGLFAVDDSYLKFLQTDLVAKKEDYKVCFLVLAPDEEPYWLTIENGNKTLGLAADTKYLMVVIATGPVEVHGH